MTLATLLSTLTTLVLGAALVSSLRCAPPGIWARLPFTYLVGALASAAVAAAAVVLRIGSFAPHVGIALGAAVIAWVVRRRRGARAPMVAKSVDVDRPSKHAIIAGCCVALLCLAAAARATAWNVAPIVQGDESEIWAAKAHAFEQIRRGASPAAALEDLGVAHADYPPLNPLLQLLVSDAGGGVAIYTGRRPMQWCGVGLIAAVYGLVASARGRRSTPWAGLAAAVAVFSGQWHSDACRQGMSDGMVAFALLFAVDAAVRGLEEEAPAHGRRLALSLAILMVAKNEGLLLAGALVSAVAFCKFRRSDGAAPTEWRRRLRRLIAVTPPAAVWAWNAAYGLENDVTSADVGFGARLMDGFAAGRAGDVAAYFGELVLGPTTATYLVAAASVFAVTALFGPRRPLDVAYLTCLAAFVGYGLVFVGTPNPLPWHLDTAAARILGHVVPTAAWAFAREATGESRRT
jgi:hypothetical protein